MKMKKRLYRSLLLIFLLIVSGSHLYAGGNYAVIKLEGSVNPIIAEHIANSIEDANSKGVQFIVLQMDTPGGLVTSTREIVKAIMASGVPVIVYTYPKGAQAASAGGFIMLSAHVAAMAPGTEIGAMHPVSPMLNFGQKDKDGGSKEGVMEKKVLNDIVAYARSLAQKRNRNVKWAERAVRHAMSSTYIEAKRAGIIDIIAEDMHDLLTKVNGRRVNVNGKIAVISTSGITEKAYEMNWKQRALNFFADPQVVFLLFIIAVIGIGMEFKNPGMIVPGVAGVISFFIFLLAIRVLPVNFAGLALIVLAIILFILELKIVSYGLLTTGGIVSFIVGSMILFDSPLPGFQIPIATIIGIAVFLLFLILVVLRSVVRTHAGKVTTGRKGLIGGEAVAMRDFDKTGKVFIHGEIWTAKSGDVIKKDDTVIVEDIKGMVLIVKRHSE